MQRKNFCFYFFFKVFILYLQNKYKFNAFNAYINFYFKTLMQNIDKNKFNYNKKNKYHFY